MFRLAIGGNALGLIPVETARADRTEGKGTYTSVKDESPEADYHFAILKTYRGKGKSAVYDEGKGRNDCRYGFVAWPAKYPQQGRLTFIANEQETIFFKESGGKPVQEYPEDPVLEGWKKLK